MKKFKKIFQPFRERSQQVGKKNLPITTISILTIGLLFLAGCSRTIEGPQTTKNADSTPEASSVNNNSSNYSYATYMTRSNNTCSDGRIFLGTDNDNRGDNIYVAAPSAVKDIKNPLQQYRIWYSGFEGQAWRIYHANSEDAKKWTKKNNEIPPEGPAGPDLPGMPSVGNGEYGTDGRIPLSPDYARDNVHVSSPSILQERNVTCIGEVPTPFYHAWYGGYDEESAAWRIFYALSMNDGLMWNKHINQVVVDLRPGTLENVNVHNPSVVLDINKYCCSCPPAAPCCCEGNRTYHMWYGGFDGEAWRIFYATSPSGKPPWERHGIALDIGDPDDCDGIHVTEPTVILEKKYASACCGSTCIEESRTYHMWYAGHGGNPDNPACKEEAWRIFYATSTDGIHWQKEKKPVLNLGNNGKGDNIYVAGPTVISDTFLGLCGESGPPFLMWYTGYDGAGWVVYKAKSSDGSTWEKVNNSTP